MELINTKSKTIESIADFTKYIELNPDASDAYNNRGASKAALPHQKAELRSRKTFHNLFENWLTGLILYCIFVYVAVFLWQNKLTT